MKYAIVILMGLLTLPAYGQVVSDEEHEAINSLFHRINSGYETLDAVKAAGTYSDSGLFVTAGAKHPVVRNNEDLEKWVFSEWFSSMKEADQFARIKFRVAERLRVGDAAITDAGYWRIETLSKESGEVLATSYGKFINIYRRDENGEWRTWADAYEANSDGNYWDAVHPVYGAEYHRD